MIKNGSKYTCVDLFSGAGGFTIGFTQADFNILLSTDFDSDCAKVHQKNMPTICIQTSLFTFNPKNW